MTKTKSTKRALLASVMALFLCFAMLLGTTYAWFTDSVTSANNIIKSGTLDVEMYYADGTKDPANVTWEDASTKAIFNHDNWEPGYTDAKHIKISNKGTLDFQWQLAIVPNGTISKLAEKIDVYYVSAATAVANRTDVDSAWYVGSLASVINSGIASGDLTVAAKEYTATIILKMKEDAGNEYQNLSIGDSFSVQLIATQLASEEDSFGKDYDANIVWDGTIPTTKPDSLVVDTTNKLISINDMQAFAYLNTLVNDANFYDNYGSKWKYTIELNTDIDLFNRAWTPITLSNFVAFNGNGHTIKNLRVATTGNSAGLFGVVSCNDIGVTYVRNLTLDGATVSGNKYVGALIGSGTQAAVENVTVNNAFVSGVKYVGGIFGSGNGSVNNCTVKNSEILIDTVVIDPEDNSIESKEAGGLIGYLSNDGSATDVNKIIAGNTVENVTITAPSIASGLIAQPNSSNSGGAKIVIENNTMKNVTITTTEDATADLYASNNVGGKSILQNNTADNCRAIKTVSASTQEELNNIGSTGNDVNMELAAGTYTFPANKLKEGMTIYCEEGTVFDGKTGFNVNGATIVGATFTNDNDFVCESTTINGTFKDCVFTDCDGLRYCYAGENVVFENCVFDTDFYGVHFDGGANDVVFKNCTFTGFNTFGSAITKLTLENCTFKYNGKGGYNGLNLWGNSELINCTFVFDGSATEWVDLCTSNQTVTFTNCVVTDGINETPLKDVVGNYGDHNTIIIDGVTVDIPNMS